MSLPPLSPKGPGDLISYAAALHERPAPPVSHLDVAKSKYSVISQMVRGVVGQSPESRLWEWGRGAAGLCIPNASTTHPQCVCPAKTTAKGPSYAPIVDRVASAPLAYPRKRHGDGNVPLSAPSLHGPRLGTRPGAEDSHGIPQRCRGLGRRTPQPRRTWRSPSRARHRNVRSSIQTGGTPRPHRAMHRGPSPGQRHLRGDRRDDVGTGWPRRPRLPQPLPPSRSRVLRRRGTWRGAYGPRLRNWFGVDQVAAVFQLLRADHASRRAVINLFDPSRDFAQSKDVPCNNWLHFLIRDGHLVLNVVTRSNDIMWGFSGINTFEWSVLHEMMAFWLGVPARGSAKSVSRGEDEVDGPARVSSLMS